ncbi:hypothetical protein [Prosthecobacter sp.]|uniref:hypothetical protein n=1 Tax=Prosthecobacter sp. TaxID=1965333 RepID=UPI003783A277
MSKKSSLKQCAVPQPAIPLSGEQELDEQWRDKYVLKDLFRLRTVDGSPTAFPQTEIYLRFRKLLNPTPPGVWSMAVCLKRISELWVERDKAHSVTSWHRSSSVRNEAFRLADRLIGAIGERLHAASQANGAERRKKINTLSTILKSAVECATTAENAKSHGSRNLLKVPANTFPFELVWSSQLRPRKLDGLFVEKYYGVKNHADLDSLMHEHEIDRTLIEAPTACVVIEYVRRLIEKNARLPTKLETRLALEQDFPELKRVSTSTFRDIFREAGLTGLLTAKPFTHPRNR